jgi:hypothetical protein
MTNAYKVIAQAAPDATTATDVYTVPASTEAVISTMIIANRAASAGTYRISVRPAGAAQSNLHYIAFDVALGANDSFTLTAGVTLAATDVITVYCSSADMSVSLFGTQITA